MPFQYIKEPLLIESMKYHKMWLDKALFSSDNMECMWIHNTWNFYD